MLTALVRSLYIGREKGGAVHLIDYDPLSAFTHGEIFVSSSACDHIPIAALNAVALTNTEATHGSLPASGGTIQHHRSEIIATRACGEIPAKVIQDVNLHRETPKHMIISDEFSNAKVVPEEVVVERRTPDIGDKEKIAESRTETFPVGKIDIIEIDDSGDEINHDSLHAPTTQKRPTEAAAAIGEEGTNWAIFTACKALQHPSDREDDTANETGRSRICQWQSGSRSSSPRPRLVTALVALCDPSRGIHPIDRSPKKASSHSPTFSWGPADGAPNSESLGCCRRDQRASCRLHESHGSKCIGLFRVG